MLYTLRHLKTWFKLLNIIYTIEHLSHWLRWILCHIPELVCVDCMYLTTTPSPPPRHPNCENINFNERIKMARPCRCISTSNCHSKCSCRIRSSHTLANRFMTTLFLYRLIVLRSDLDVLSPGILKLLTWSSKTPTAACPAGFPSWMSRSHFWHSNRCFWVFGKGSSTFQQLSIKSMCTGKLVLCGCSRHFIQKNNNNYIVHHQHPNRYLKAASLCALE